jgi:hypothetical protein
VHKEHKGRVREPKELGVIQVLKVLRDLKGQVREPKERQALLVHKVRKEHKGQIKELKVGLGHKVLRET